MTDPISWTYRGCRFVRFTDEQDQQRAFVDIQGVYCHSRLMRNSTATSKKLGGAGPAGITIQGGIGGANMLAVPIIYSMNATSSKYLVVIDLFDLPTSRINNAL